ncbi:hypothetical protein [Halarcobacter sp.]|uniref:hypothetical protein n=1 Tax=Halarcobacter sp. TaxID=2321133 RepID=UPI0029F550BD|nr:hypothetical protein [Halarcobacter sp.]
MSKLEFINNHMKNTKLKKEKLLMICNCFAEDLTAIETAKKVGLSRQTINSYYKIIRTYLIDQQNMSDSLYLSSCLNEDSLTIKYFIYNSNPIFYIQDGSRIYFINEENKILNKLNQFINNTLKDLLINHKRANCARVLLNANNNEYYVSSFLKSSNEVETFIINRLKKFRGINKTNYTTHIKESFIRHNYTQESFVNQLSNFFKL